MSSRTSRSTITFSRPFTLSGVDGEQPAGTYAVETEEELVEGPSFPVYRRLTTVITLPLSAGGMAGVQRVGTDPEELAEAQRRDTAGSPWPATTVPPPSPGGRAAPDDLAAVLDSHRAWVASDGRRGERADLRGLDLAGRSFWRADLRRALLDQADLTGADLDHADLRGASLPGARLAGASLWEAKLGMADLRNADLSGAKLDHADLRGAELTGAGMDGASLTSARLDGPHPVPAGNPKA